MQAYRLIYFVVTVPQQETFFGSELFFPELCPAIIQRATIHMLTNYGYLRIAEKSTLEQEFLEEYSPVIPAQPSGSRIFWNSMFMTYVDVE